MTWSLNGVCLSWKCIYGVLLIGNNLCLQARLSLALCIVREINSRIWKNAFWGICLCKCTFIMQSFWQHLGCDKVQMSTFFQECITAMYWKYESISTHNLTFCPCFTVQTFNVHPFFSILLTFSLSLTSFELWPTTVKE